MLEALRSIKFAVFSHAKTMEGGTNTALVLTNMKGTQKEIIRLSISGG